MFLCEFYEILRTPVLQKQNTSGRLLLSRQLISQKIFIVDAWLGSKYAFAIKCKPMASIWYEFLQKTFSKQAIEIWILILIVQRNTHFFYKLFQEINTYNHDYTEIHFIT